MKKFFVLIIAMLCLTLSVEARTFVLCVGISNYQDSQLNLTQTTKDAKAFRDVMKHQTRDITILTSRYANKANILEKLRAICNRAQKNDKIIFFYSGHGYPGGMAVFDGFLSYQEFNDVLARSEASAKICFIDACHAGSVEDVKDPTKAYKAPSDRNVIYMMSCRADEYSVEHAWVGHGYFTQALLKGIRGKADANGDKKITVRELFTYVYNDVQHTTAKLKDEQHPQLIGSKAVADEVVAVWK